MQAYPSSFRSHIENLHGEDAILCHIVSIFKDMITTALFSGLILDICRSAPLKTDQIKSEQIKAWGKEYSVCTRERLPHRINFDVLFREECRNESITPYVAPNPRMADYVRSRLELWREETCQKLHYPRLSTKQSSYDTMRHYEELTGEKWVTESREGGVEFNQLVLERFYCETGYEIPGVSEMRQKWYKSGTTPRTYFAQGGTTFSKSKYMQGMFLDLVDHLDCTNHVSRLNPSRILLDDPEDYLRIYDLSSFTSNCHEQASFCSHLASFCSGYSLRLFDSCKGIILEDLGHLISEFNQVCNEFPLFSLERLDKSEHLGPISHTNASFLGVYGNLATCTFLHGAVVLQAFDSPDSLNVAGDDGHFRQKPGFEDVVTDLIRSIGVVETTKEFDSREDGAVCLKRGLYQHSGRIYQKLMVIWPSFHSLGTLLGFRSPQFSPFDPGMSKNDFRNLVGNEILRFLSHLYYAKIQENIDFVLQFLLFYYQQTNLPEYGSLPQCNGKFLCPVLPTSKDDLYREHPLDKLLRTTYNGSAMVTCSWDEARFDDETEGIGYSVGYSWRGRMTGYLSHMQKLGFVQSEKLKEFVWGDWGFERLKEDFDPYRIPVYDFLVLEDIPIHLQGEI